MSEQNSSTEEFHEVTPSDFQALHTEAQAEIERLKAVIAAGRIAPVSEHPQANAKPAVTAQRLTAMLGTHGVNRLTRAEKIQALGLDPNGVSDDLLRACWGRGNDGAALSELHKTSPLRARQLREAAILLNIFGN